MALFTATGLAFDLSVDANYHAFWGAFFDAKIQALGGWTYVAQTGDGNPNSVAAGTTGTYACFRCYSTVVGSTTWYMRMDMGWATGEGPKWKYQFGTAVNGSGVLSGQVSTQCISTNRASTGAGQTAYISTDTGRLTFIAGITTNNSTWAGFTCHGNVDANGSMISGMETFGFAIDAQITPTCQYIPLVGTVPAKKAYWPCNLGVEADQSIGSTLVKGHPMLWDASGCNNPTMAVACFPATNYAGVTNVTNCTLYGRTVPFLLGGAFAILSGIGTTINAGMRYE